MTDRDEPPAEAQQPPASTGRHGGGTGLSVAELIARTGAASAGTGPRLSRSARHAGQDADIAEDAAASAMPTPPASSGAGPAEASPAASPAEVSPAASPAEASPGVTPAAAAPARHLRIVEALRSGGSGKPARGGLALVEPPAGRPDTAAASTARPSTAKPPDSDTSEGSGGTGLGTAPSRNGRHPAGSPAGTVEALATAQPSPPELSPSQLGPADISTPEIAKPPRKSRAGRNLPAAIGVGVGLALLVIGTLTVYRPSFVVLLGIAVAIGVYEMVTAIGTVGARPPLVPLLAGVLAMEAAAWFRGPDGLVGALLLTVWRLADGATGYLRDVAAGNLVALYIPFLAGFAALMTRPDDGAARIVLFILTVVCSDTGGYAVGVLIGKHPMAPTVSPKKSWEGFAGSLLAGAVEGVLMMVFCFHQQWWQGALFGAAIVVTATLGDLGESMIKRDLGLKDMGKLLPGHGGLMDRLDSLLLCAPVAYLLMAAFLPG